MSSFDLLILGAGIVGSAIARECALAGMRVGIVEPAVPGGAATAAGMGHVVAMDDSPAQLALSHLSRTLWRDLLPQLPAAVEYETRGTLWVAADEEEMQEVRGKHGTYTAAGIPTSILDSHALALAEPNLRPGLAGGLLVPGDAVVYPPAAAAFFLAEATRHGAQLLRGQRAIHLGNGSVTLADGTQHFAPHIVLSTGTDLSLLPWLPIAPRKGHLLITERHPGFAHHQLVELGYLKSAHKTTADSVAFNLQPRQTGQLLIGSSRQFGDSNPAVEGHILHRMLERATTYMPALSTVSGIRVWTGFRAATADKLPLLGPLPEDPATVLAMGFEGLGITNSTGAARLVADHLLGRAPALDPTPYLPARLARTTPLPEPVHA